MYLHQANQGFVEGSRTHLANKAEVMSNLTRQLGFQTMSAMWYINIATVCFGIGLFVFGTVTITVYFYFFFRTYLYQSHSVTLGLTLLGLPMLSYPLVKGYQLMVQPWSVMQFQQYAENLYDLLISKGRIKKAKVKDINILTYEIIYTIQLESERVESRYMSSVKPKFAPNDTISVLYLNDLTNIVL